MQPSGPPLWDLHQFPTNWPAIAVWNSNRHTNWRKKLGLLLRVER